MNTLFHLREGLQMAKRRIAVAKSGTRKYTGDAPQICQQIVAHCWNGTFFQVSTGHFSLFYIRDFGICVDALLQLGYEKEVEKTLQFALTVYSCEKRISTTISSHGKGFDVFSYAPDSLAFLLSSLRIAEAVELVEIYQPFLEQQLQYFYDTVVDSQTGLVRSDRYFSSLKDHAKRKQCCYNACCVAVVAREAEALGLQHPFKNDEYNKMKEKIKKIYWTGAYFRDVPEQDYVAGDANVFPYWFGIFTDKHMIQSSLAAMQKEKLDQPFPLKYTSFVPKHFLFFPSLFAPNYEGTSIWPHLGLCFIEVVAVVDTALAKKYIEEYRKCIEKHKNFLELFDDVGNPYKTHFYYADEGMLWAAKWLMLEKSL